MPLFLSVNRISLIGCGESGALWDGKGESIGVNDCEKFGKHVDYLLLLNHRAKFSDERLRVIEASRPKICYSHIVRWHSSFSVFKLIETRSWPGTEILPGVIYHSKTSPFCAISLAHVMGFNEIVLWGVDFVSHHAYRPGKPYFEAEKIRYEKFAEMLEKHGTNVYLGAPGTLNIPIL